MKSVYISEISHYLTLINEYIKLDITSCLILFFLFLFSFLLFKCKFKKFPFFSSSTSSSSSSNLSKSSTSSTSSLSTPSTSNLNRKSNAGIENIASAQAQRIASKMTPDVKNSSDMKGQNDIPPASPYGALIDSLASKNTLTTPKINIDDHETSSNSSNSTEDLSESSNRKKSDLHRFTFSPKSSLTSTSTSTRSDKYPSTSTQSQPPNQSFYDQILKTSIKKPEILIGWKIEVPEFGRGIILDYEKKKFRSTKFRILFDNQQEKLLKLKRSEKKGKIPFILLEISGK